MILQIQIVHLLKHQPTWFSSPFNGGGGAIGTKHYTMLRPHQILWLRLVLQAFLTVPNVSISRGTLQLS
jgi:hypothetical protein